MKLLFTICARAGSKGLKNKNVMDFLGRPLCLYTIETYEKFRSENPKYICELALNTDSRKLVEQVTETGIDFSFIGRTKELAGDRVGKIEVIKDTFQKMNSAYDYIIDLDITSPLRTAQDIENGLNAMLANPNADCAFSMTEARRSPYFNQVQKRNNGFYGAVIDKGAVSRQEVPKVFDMNASIYVYRQEYLLKAKRLFDGNWVGFLMKDTAVLDIDCLQDKELMEVVAKHIWEKE